MTLACSVGLRTTRRPPSPGRGSTCRSRRPRGTAPSCRGQAGGPGAEGGAPLAGRGFALPLPAAPRHGAVLQGPGGGGQVPPHGGHEGVVVDAAGRGDDEPGRAVVLPVVLGDVVAPDGAD